MESKRTLCSEIFVRALSLSPSLSLYSFLGQVENVWKHSSRAKVSVAATIAALVRREGGAGGVYECRGTKGRGRFERVN